MNKQTSLVQLKKNLMDRQVSIGSWMQIANCEIAEIMSSGNFDWIAIDLEHGFFNSENIPNLVRSLELNNVLPFARIPKNDFNSLRTCLESGVVGIIHANVESATQIDNLVKATIYSPIGTRGLGYSRYNLYGKKIDTIINETGYIFNVAMIETATGVQNLKEILSVKGIDAVLVGPFDLSMSLGIPGDFENPVFLENISEIYKTCSTLSIPFGTHIIKPNLDTLNIEVDKGALFVPYSMDTEILGNYSQVPRFRH
jgi:2-dehydro-3-deoxyglucarate aldolase